MTGQIVLVVLVVVVVLSLLWWFGKRKAKETNRKVTDIFLSRLKIVIGFYQVTVGTIEAFAYVKWPAFLSDISKLTAVAQLNILQLAPLQCMDGHLRVSAFDNMYLMLAFNLSIVATAVLVYLLRYALLYLKQNTTKKELEMILSETRVTLYRNTILVIFIIFPGTCSSITRAIPCHEICQSGDDTQNCKSYLRADYSIECNASYTNKKHSAYFSMLYIILIPMLAFLFLFKHFKRLRGKRKNITPILEQTNRNFAHGESNVPAIIGLNGKALNGKQDSIREDRCESELVQAMAFLYENYEYKTWYWELVEATRKVLLVSCLILIGEESRAYVGLGSIVSGFYAILFAYKQPMIDLFENRIQMLSLTVTFANLGTGVIMKIPKESAQFASNFYLDGVVVEVLLVAVNLSVM